MPIRIIDEATLKRIWQPGIFRYEVRRLKEDAILPHPQELFSVNAPAIQREFSVLADTPSILSQNTSIMWEEEEKNLATISWFHIVNNIPTFLDNTGKSKIDSRLYKPLLSSTHIPQQSEND